MNNKLTGNEIRRAFLDFFKDKHQHTEVKSSSLIPDNPTVLLTTAGMLQFVPIFLGYKKPPYTPPRATTCQKCARAGGKDSDIENVGRTPRHHTFFEMLGNFSFGDYFKKEIIPWSWDFITNYLKLEKDKLWITVFETDDEAFDIWHNDVGIPKERILRKGKKDNFWGPPGATGPCGPCSEIHYDLGEHLKCSDDCSIETCECDRWVEIWNLVFMEMFQDEEGTLSPLEKKNVDTGMGLERITMVVQGKTSTFETDLLTPILNKVCEISGKKYGENSKTDISMRIITDHARCVSFMISDGLKPSNEGRNYVLRMILRRALRHGKMLGLELPFLYNLIDVIVENYKGAYPELEQNKEKIKKVIKEEEERFGQTLEKGQKLLEEIIPVAKAQNNTITADEAFKLYDTFGFPMELTQEIAHENSLTIDIEGFQKLMKEQKERAKAAAQKISLTDDLIYVDIENHFGATEFLGYESTEANAKVIAKVEADAFIDIILDKTPFYAESGGQVGDTGIIEGENFKAEVLNTFKVNKLFVHRSQIIEGEVSACDEVTAKIDKDRRQNITIHHSNAHLLQAALIKVLGDEVKQAGSQVDEGRTRFDFSYPRALTKEEVEKIEALINCWIAKDCGRITNIMEIEEAKKTGAMALFGEKYDEKVRVVKIGEISSELCGGTHVDSTSQIRLSKITSEGAIAAGTRRIEAVCGDNALCYLNEKAKEIDELALKLKIPHDEVMTRVEKVLEENRALQNEIGQLKAQAAQQKFQSFVSKAQDISGGKLFISKIENFDAQAVKTGSELLESKLGNSIIVLISENGEQLVIMVKVSDDFVKKGINAGQIVNKIASATGGKGGGRPNFAQGAGKKSDNLDSILQEVETEIKSLLN